MSKLFIPVGSKDHIRGNHHAPVTLLEYGDYECPYCGQAHNVVMALQAQLGDTVRFVFRNFPLTQIHPHAFNAALAAEAAAQQGKFWQMHDLLFENQDRLEDDHLVGYASLLRLDIDRFIEDFEMAEIEKRVRDDFLSGVKSGVNGTPTFFINGVRHDGSFQLPGLLAAVERATRQVYL
ncbi:MAG: DsbA family protein [Chloroflexi bacterium]|nr:DsbA family protein [Chloroflexota bacterium]OJV88235.1 MAG: disulfide bond formation protein DsbA [Chloroflexi bacterium 54-19]